MVGKIINQENIKETIQEDLSNKFRDSGEVIIKAQWMAKENIISYIKRTYQMDVIDFTVEITTSLGNSYATYYNAKVEIELLGPQGETMYFTLYPSYVAYER